jgi:hypothetical protein
MRGDGTFEVVTERVLRDHPEDEPGRMLQSPGLRTDGRFYAFAPVDALVVKLPADRVTALVGAGRGEPCSPRPGRPMREWVRIPAPDEETALSYVLEARAFVAGAGARRSREVP